MDIVYCYTAAVRGYHYYKQFWKLVENEELHCYHEKYNLYDKFAIKTVHKNGETVGHLPREISRVTNSRWYGNPTSVFFSMPSTLKNAQITERYLQSVKER